MSEAAPKSPSRPPSVGGQESSSETMDTTQPIAKESETLPAHETQDEPLPTALLPDSYDTPPFPTSPRLDPSSPRNFSTISSLSGSRDLGRPVLEPTTKIFTASPSIPALQTTSASSPLQAAVAADDVVPDIADQDASAVAFHVETQGLMQMLSLVGSTFFEADREGFTEDETEETDSQLPPTDTRGTPSQTRPTSSEAEGGTRNHERRLAGTEGGRQSLDYAPMGLGKGRVHALAKDDGSDDGSTPQGGSSPLSASVLTIGPTNSKRRSLTHSDIIGTSRDSTLAKPGRKTTNLRSQLYNVASASSVASSSRLDDETTEQGTHESRQASSSPVDRETTDAPIQAARFDASTSQLGMSARMSPRGVPDPLLIRPYSDLQASGDADTLSLPTDRDRLIQQLTDIFALDAAEDLLLAQPCWLFRSLLLQGHLYLTRGHICFYAYLPSRDEKTIKTGMLRKAHAQDASFQ